jgi:hypothetical protein
MGLKIPQAIREGIAESLCPLCFDDNFDDNASNQRKTKTNITVGRTRAERINTPQKTDCLEFVNRRPRVQIPSPAPDLKSLSLPEEEVFFTPLIMGELWCNRIRLVALHLLLKSRLDRSSK